MMRLPVFNGLIDQKFVFKINGETHTYINDTAGHLFLLAPPVAGTELGELEVVFGRVVHHCTKTNSFIPLETLPVAVHVYTKADYHSYVSTLTLPTFVRLGGDSEQLAFEMTEKLTHLSRKVILTSKKLKSHFAAEFRSFPDPEKVQYFLTTENGQYTVYALYPHESGLFIYLGKSETGPILK